MSDVSYPLAAQGVFWTVQGEGALLGEPMVFVRLAGCSVGCRFCDTDYRVAERRTPQEIARKVAELLQGARFVWVTGGEPTDHDLGPLLAALKRLGPDLRLCLATAGHRRVSRVFESERWDWLSVSPHDPAKWVQGFGEELKLVPGLDGFGLGDFEPLLAEKGRAFCHRFVSPCADDPASVRECLEWVRTRPGWRMTTQAHKGWRIP